MTLPSSGEMTAAMINVEMGFAWNAPSAACRELAGIPSGPIKFSDFYGKSGTPPIARTNMVAGYRPGDAWSNRLYGYDQLASGAQYRIGSLSPSAVMNYPGGSFGVGQFSWATQGKNLTLWAVSGQQRSGRVVLMNAYGDVLNYFDFFGTWYKSGGYVYQILVTENPFINGGQYQFYME